MTFRFIHLIDQFLQKYLLPEKVIPVQYLDEYYSVVNKARLKPKNNVIQ